MTYRKPKFLTAPVLLAIFVAVLFAGHSGGAWALPRGVAFGQTIPLPPTATPTATAVSLPSSTWTPRPTWTRVPTQPTEPPTATPGVGLPTLTATPAAVLPTLTATPEGGAPTLTRAPIPSGTLVPPVATATPAAVAPTPTVPLPPGRPSATATVGPAEPSALVFEIAVQPQVAGPADEVQFILQVANVGYGAVDDVQVEVLFPDGLQLQFVECARCATDCPQCKASAVPRRLTIFLGDLPAADQVIAPVWVEVAEDAWPGQTLRTDWRLTATGLAPQTAQASLELPWAALPDTGGAALE